MYNLRLSSEELSMILYSLVTTMRKFRQDPALFEREIIETKALLEKLSTVKYVAEED